MSDGEPQGRVAIFHPPGRMTLARNPFGKDVANLALWRGLARHGGYERIDVLSLRLATAEALKQDLFEGGPAQAGIGGAPLPGARAPAEAGVLLRGQPDLYDLAWMRRRQASDRARSSNGVPSRIVSGPSIRQPESASVAGTVPNVSTMQIGVNQYNPSALFRQRDRQVDGQRGDTGPALAPGQHDRLGGRSELADLIACRAQHEFS